MDRELAEIRIGLPTHRLHHGARRAMVAHQVREQRSGEAPPVHRRLGPERREQHVTLVEPAFVGAEHEQHLFPVFDLERRGLLSQRVGDPIEPGSEEEPYVPAVGTRARARAKFIKEHSGRTDLIMSWDRVFELPNERVRTLFDPFAEAYAG